MAEDTIATLEQEDTETSGWSTMDSGKRDSYVAGLHEQVAAEKAEEAPSTEAKAADRARDASGRFAKTSAEETTETTPASGDETPVADDAAPAPETVVGNEEVKGDWRDAGVKDLVAAYGLDDESLAAIPTREVLDVVLKGIDKKAFLERQAAQGQAVATQQEQVQQSGQQATDDAIAKLEAIKFDEELGADDAAKLKDGFAAVVAELKEQRAWRAQQQQLQVQDAGARLRADVLTNLQKLGHTTLYGEPGKPLTNEQKANVKAVTEDHIQRGSDLARRGGMPSPDNLELLKRSVFAVNGEDIVNQTKQEHLAKLRAQSSRRTGGGSTNPSRPAKGATPLERAMNGLPALRQSMDLVQE
jgi:hypothetical protein